MKKKKQILTAFILSGSVGLGANSLFAQGAPGSGQPGPTAPQPRQTQPTIPGQPAPGQVDPMPGQPGTIPERIERPRTGDQGTAGVTADDIKKAKEALKAKGHSPGPIDGVLDGKTQQALRDFQKANKLPVTGLLDANTAEKLGLSLDKGTLPSRERGPMPQGKGGVK
jgi:hypothetical protein